MFIGAEQLYIIKLIETGRHKSWWVTLCLFCVAIVGFVFYDVFIVIIGCREFFYLRINCYSCIAKIVNRICLLFDLLVVFVAWVQLCPDQIGNIQHDALMHDYLVALVN